MQWGPSSLDVILLILFGIFCVGGLVFWKMNVFSKYKRIVVSGLVLTLSMIVMRGFIFEFFTVPSESMAPTVLESDVLMVRKFSYNLRVPITRDVIKKVSSPSRGDIVVFYLPEDTSFYYLKRVMAIPGDEVFIKDNQVYVNGKSTFIEATSLKFEDTRGGEHSLGRLKEKNNIQGVLFYTLKPTSLEENKFWIIPPGKFLAMGDNRGLSRDSREFGLVSESWLIGKATRVAFNKEGLDRWLQSYYVSPSNF